MREPIAQLTCNYRDPVRSQTLNTSAAPSVRKCGDEVGRGLSHWWRRHVPLEQKCLGKGRVEASLCPDGGLRLLAMDRPLPGVWPPSACEEPPRGSDLLLIPEGR